MAVSEKITPSQIRLADKTGEASLKKTIDNVIRVVNKVSAAVDTNEEEILGLWPIYSIMWMVENINPSTTIGGKWVKLCEVSITDVDSIAHTFYLFKRVEQL